MAEMTKTKFDATVKELRAEARDWIDNEIAPQQMKFWEYYNGRVDAKPPKGRSQFVLTELRDAVESSMVSLLRIFLTTTPARFVPTNATNIDEAQQRTDTANFVFMTENDGFRILNDAFRDALVAKYGVLQTYWSKAKRVEFSEYEGLSEQAANALASDPKTEVLEVEEKTPEIEVPEGIEIPRTFDMKVKTTFDEGGVKVEAVPSEEFIITRRASTPDTATCVGRDGLRRARDVINDKLATKAEIEKSGASAHADNDTGSGNSTNVRAARDNLSQSTNTQTSTATSDDKGDDLIRVSELYVRIDRDMDGIPELYRVIMIGDSVTDSELWDIQPFDVASPVFRPHTALGFGLGDVMVELQDLGTAVSRQMLDSLYAHVNPRKWAIQNQVNLNDLARNAFNDTVRVRAANAIGHLETPFVGADAMPILSWSEERKEMRTGTSKAALGLDPDALQSSTEFGVMSVFTAAQSKTESMARSLGSMVSGSYDRIGRLLAMHQKPAKVIELRGTYVEVDPRHWVDAMKVQPSVGLGRGTQQEKTNALQMIVSKQEALLAQLGGDNPVVTVPQYAQSLNDLIQIGGETNPQRYINSPQQVAEFIKRKEAEEAQNPPEQDPAQQAAQAELMLKKEKQDGEQRLNEQKAKASQDLDEQKAQAAQQLDTAKAVAAQELDEQVAASNFKLKQLEIGLETQLEVLKIQTTPITPGEGELRSPVNGG